MNNKTKIVLFGGLALFILVLLGYLLSSLSDEPGTAKTELPDHQFESWDEPAIENLDPRAMTLFDDSIQLSYDQIIEQARTGKISLVSELWRLRRKCPAKMERFECNNLLRQYIMENFPAPDNQKLSELLVKYLKYEEEMTRLNLSTDLTLEERYAAIRRKRRDFFGDDTAQLIFGLEESKHDLNQGLAEFKKESQDMSGDERVAAYEKMRREALGDYYETVVEREPPFHKYNTELELRAVDLQKLSSTEKESQTRQLRQKYFGNEGAERMAKVDQLLQAEKEAEAKLQSLEADFRKKNPELEGQKLEAALMDLRIRHLGSKEAAEAYTRRQNISR